MSAGWTPNLAVSTTVGTSTDAAAWARSSGWAKDLRERAGHAATGGALDTEVVLTTEQLVSQLHPVEGWEGEVRGVRARFIRIASSPSRPGQWAWFSVFSLLDVHIILSPTSAIQLRWGMEHLLPIDLRYFRHTRRGRRHRMRLPNREVAVEDHDD